MSVLLVVSETVTGAEVSDALEGGDTGLDFGQVSNGSYSPLSSQVANTGHQDIYLSHNAVVDEITSVKTYVAQFSGTYGGADTAADDLTTLLAYGASDTGATKNNTDGNSEGLHIDQDWQVSTANQFDYSREATGQKRIYGKDYSGLDGSDLANAFPLHADACSFWNGSSEIDATTPVTGKIGLAADTVLGNRGHLKSRFYLSSGTADGGILQWDWVFAYSYTA